MSLVVELRGGVALHRKREVAARHAAAVVGDGDAPPSASLGEDVDAGTACVDGVLHKLLHGTRGPLHHFAGGDAVDDLFGKLTDGHEVPGRLDMARTYFTGLDGSKGTSTESTLFGFPLHTGLMNYRICGRYVAEFPRNDPEISEQWSHDAVCMRLRRS